MAEFSAVANLRVVPTGLDAAKREIERELGDLEVGVSANRPTGDGGGVGGAPTGSTALMIEIQRRTLTAQQASADFDEERNVILEDILDTLQDGGTGGGGGGGALRMAGTAGLALGGASALGAASVGPFAALAGLTLAGGAAAAATTTEEERRRGNVPAGPGPRTPPSDPEDTIRQGRRAAPAPGPVSPVTTEPPDRAPRQGGQKTENNVNVNANADISVSDSLQRSEIERFTQRRIKQAAEDIKRDILNQLGDSTGPRTVRQGRRAAPPPGSGTPRPRMR